VFDFDDTLTVDTGRQKNESLINLFDDSAFGQDMARAFVHAHQGQGLQRRQKIEGILHEMAEQKLITYTPELVEQYLERFSQQAETIAIEAALRPEAEELLKALSEQHAVYLNSHTPHDSLQKIVQHRGWDRFLQGAYGAPPGSKKEHLKIIMEGEKSHPHKTIVIGDGQNDLAAAQEHGCHFIGISGHTFSFDENQFLIVRHLSQVIPTIEKLFFIDKGMKDR